MYKFKKGMEKLSSNDFKIISVLLEFLNVNHLAKIYYSMFKSVLMKKIHKIKNEKSTPSIKIDDFLNTEYNQYSDYNNTDSFLSLLDHKYKEINANEFNHLFYNMVEFASKLYLLPKDITPAKKADLISFNAYITVLNNLKKTILSLPKNKIKLIEKNLNSLIIEMEDREHLVLEEILAYKKLTGKVILELLTKENCINNIKDRKKLSRILIKTVNTIINTLCHEDKVFTQIDTKASTFILFKVNEKISWMLEVSPFHIIKSSKHLTQEITSLIIFLPTILLDLTYLPLDDQLPSFNLTQSEKDALIKRNNRFSTLTSELNEKNDKINALEKKLNKKINAIIDFDHKINQYEKTILQKEEHLIDLEDTLKLSKEQFMQLISIYEPLHLKKTSNPRVEKKLLSLKDDYDVLSHKINTLKTEIREVQNNLKENELLKKQLEEKLVTHNREITKLKIEIALFKREIREYEQEKQQLKSSNAIYFSIHWGKYFNALKISSKVYDSLLSYPIDALLLIERILVELDESTAPKAIGHKIKDRKNKYYIHIKDENKSIGKILYKVDAHMKIFLKEITE